MLTIQLRDLSATEAFGHQLGAALFPGAVVALVGPLGAGKTHLVRAVAAGLGIENPDIVSSPTFVLIQEYAARQPIYHFDAYRLSGAAEFAELGTHEYFQSDGVCLVEWADRVRAALPAELLEIRISITGPESRRIELLAQGVQYDAILQKLAGISQDAGKS